MSKFTAGPWIADQKMIDQFKWDWNILSPDKTKPLAVVDRCYFELAEAKANAHLIAAAPEMYEALVKIRVLMGEIEGKSTTQSFEAAAIIANVLRKARGES